MLLYLFIVLLFFFALLAIPALMAGLSDVSESGPYYAQNAALPKELFEDVVELPVLHIEEQSGQSSEGEGQTEDIFSLKQEDASRWTEDYCPMATEHSKEASEQTESHESNELNSNPDECPYKNGDFKFSIDGRDIFTCHTGTIEKVYRSRHTYTDPKRDVRLSLDEDLFDDCLNYLECPDVMTMYANGFWQQVLQGNDPAFLLENDQDNESSETKVSLYLLNGCDPLQGGVSCLNGESNDTVVLDASTGLCDSHSESSEEAVKRELPRDCLKALQPEMVITVGHKQDEMSSVKSKERCKVASAAAAIQNDRAGIEEENKENGQRRDVSASTKTSNINAIVKMFPKNELDKEVLNVRKNEPMEIPLIHACSLEVRVDGEPMSQEDKLTFFGEECQRQKDGLKNISRSLGNGSATTSFQGVNKENSGLIQEGTTDRQEQMDTKYEHVLECAGRTSEGEKYSANAALTQEQHPLPNNLSCTSTDQLSGNHQRTEKDFSTCSPEYKPMDFVAVENKQNLENSIETVNELDKEQKERTICSSMDTTKISADPRVENEKGPCFPTGMQSALDNGAMFVDGNERTNDTKSNGKQTHGNSPKHDSHSKKKSRNLLSRSNSCILKKEVDQIKNNKVKELIANEVGSSACNSPESKSKGTDNTCSPNATDYIPKSQELILVCSISDTIKENGFTKMASILNDTQHAAAGASATEGKKSSRVTENKAAKKKLKAHGKELDKSSKCIERQTSLATEAFTGGDEQRDSKECGVEAATIKDHKKAPQLLCTMQAEMFPNSSGNLKLHCCFSEIHADSTVTWMKDSKLLARLHRSANDDSPVSLAISQISQKDQGQYQCSLKNMYGKVSAEFLLTSEVLEQLSRCQDIEGGEEIEFNQLLFREDFITDMYFGGNLRGRIATEDLHFGEGVHRKAFRSKVMCGLLPVFNPGHICVLKVHNAIAYGTKNIDELVQRNYKLAVQECYVQNTAREYAKIYAAEAEQLEEFGKVPEIIPIFLIHRPENNIPYATVEEELIGEFVKYSVRDGKEINVLRRDSEAGQKCCTFQHWVYEKTSGNLLVTDMQGVGMKLTDVGIATLGKGFKGFKGNCSGSFIDQFKVLHLCNKYCEILGLRSLKAPQKQKKPSPAKEKSQSNPPSSKKNQARHKTKKQDVGI